jgi:hypothetical protein
MGGFGSGRPRGAGRRRVEDCRALVVDQLHRAGCLRARWAGEGQWGHNGAEGASIHLRAEPGRLHLSYRIRVAGTWEDVTETVDIVRVPCRLGGTRPFFLCPGVVGGVVCGRRVAKLYGPGRYFLCRHCYQLVYASQSASEVQRRRRRASKIWQRLGGEPGPLAPPPPKGMPLDVYARLLEELLAAEALAEEACARLLERLLERIEKWERKGDPGGL